LMLENRSLDNLFGGLYTAGGPPLRFYPAGSPQQFDGIPSGATLPAYDWWGDLREYPIVPIPVAQLLADGNDPSIVPWWDPTEEYLSRFDTGRGVLNQIFGDESMVSTEPPFGTPPTMLGFLQDYWTAETGTAYGGMDICWTFAPSQIPNLSSAARHGAISDAWFASVPTQTNPNRAYSLVGTSLGRDANLRLSAVEQFDVPTIFNALTQAGKSCGLYFTDTWHAGQCFTQYTFPQLTSGCGEIVFRAPDGSAYPFDHTSLIKTLLGWAGADIGSAGFFDRMPQAPAFDDVLSRDDTAAADNDAAIQQSFAGGPLPAPAETQPLRTNDALFEGVSRSSVRHIAATSRTPAQMVAKIAEYNCDREKFEASLVAE
ncbi:MAG: phospholipase, partial [Candidatus Eremiobacteraeota bacterium]|nr:phospholipase [Candidatus Eremiobacteraeota bacterium]